MSTVVQLRDARTPAPSPERDGWGPSIGVVLAVLAVIAGRLPFLDGWLTKDEAGFLTVARQWHPGSSLYGDYWVDRPPLLITVFRAAAALGGAVPLRLIGIGAAVVTVLAVAHAARTLAGPRAAAGSAVTAAAFLISPRTGAIAVNGELLAAPFVAIGCAATLTMLTAVPTRRAVGAAFLAGAAGLLAVLVKQNMLDVFVFTSVLILLQARHLAPDRLVIAVGGFIGGLVTAGTTMVIWTLANGTSLSGVWFAMYRFRVQATAVITANRSPGPDQRGHTLLHDVVLSGMVLTVVLLLVTVVRVRGDHPSGDPVPAVARAVPLALVLTLTYDAISIYLGQNYWIHYLVQPVVPLALSAGLAAAYLPRTSATVIAAVLVSAVWATIGLAQHPASVGGNRLGAQIAAVARPGDTIVTVWGNADVTHASGLPSPYPYLWSLPAQILDPHVELLTATLTGPHAPTWFVTWSGTGLHHIDVRALKSALHRHYHRITERDGHVIYLHNGINRPWPPARTMS